MFYEELKDDLYFRNVTDISKSNKDLYFPIEIDTEFQDKHYPFQDAHDKKVTISVQMKPIHGTSSFFLHSDMEPYSERYEEYPILKHDFCIFDLIEQYGYNVLPVNNIDMLQIENLTIHNLYIHIYGFHLVSDIMRLFQNEWLELIEARILEPNHTGGNIKHGKRLYCYNNKLNNNTTYIDTFKHIIILNKYYRIYKQLNIQINIENIFRKININELIQKI